MEAAWPIPTVEIGEDTYLRALIVTNNERLERTALCHK